MTRIRDTPAASVHDSRSSPRSNSRTSSHHMQAAQGTPTPGLIHIAPSVLQRGTSSPSSGRRSRGNAQRNNKSKTGHREGQAVESHAAPAASEDQHGLDASVDSDTAARPARSQDGGSARPARQQPTATATDLVDDVSRLSVNTQPIADQDGLLLASRPPSQKGLSASTPRKPKYSRVQSHQTPTASTDQLCDGGDDGVNRAVAPPSPSLLSKSAPAHSLLAKARSATQAEYSQKGSNQLNRPQHNSNLIRGSNSADEWDMPYVAKGNDVLTWQQQDLSRKGSTRSNKNNNNNNSNNNRLSAQAFAKKTINDKTTPGSDYLRSDMPSGISAMAAAAAASPKSIPPTPITPAAPAASALTWQQELLRGSAPATSPTSSLFSALEAGHSGAHPAKDHRQRSSPTKQQRKQRAAGEAVPTLDEDIANESFGHLKLGSEGDAVDLDAKKPTTRKQRGGKKASIAADSNISAAQGRTHVEHDHNTRLQHRERAARSGTNTSESETEAVPANATEPISIPRQASSTAAGRPPAPSSSPTKTQLYAGPKFHNSPSAGQLPTPRLAAFLSRNKDGSTPPPAGPTLAA